MTMCKSSHFCTKGSDKNKTRLGETSNKTIFSHLENCMKHSTAINIFPFNLTLFRALCRSAFSLMNNMEPIKKCLLISNDPDFAFKYINEKCSQKSFDNVVFQLPSCIHAETQKMH